MAKPKNVHRPFFVRSCGRWWIGFEQMLTADGWLINCFGIGLFIPADWVWRVKNRVRTKLHL